MNDTELRLEAGSVVALGFYDLGRRVDVDALASRGESERPQFPSDGSAGVRYGARPVELALDDVEVPLEDGRVFADVSVRVFDFGIAAVALRVLVGGLEWDRFSERVDEISAALSGRGGVWQDIERRVGTRLGGAQLSAKGGPVARHLFVIARRFGSALPLDELIDDEYAAAIVSREWRPLTSIARADLLRTARVAGTDLVVIGEDRSFLVEATPGSGVPDAVEAALAQRAAYDACLAAPDGTAAARVASADALLTADRGGRLESVVAAARERFRVADVAGSAGRATASLSRRTPLAALIIVGVLSAVLTAALILALG